MYDTRLEVMVPKCGHGMHIECLHKYLESNIACPICKKSLVDPKLIEE
jgi:ribosomal protein S27E